MIRVPTAIPVFTIRSFEPLVKSPALASFIRWGKAKILSQRRRSVEYEIH